MNVQSNRFLPRWLPLAVGGLLSVLLVGLGFWQLERGDEKRAERLAFETGSRFTPFINGMPVEQFEQIRVNGVLDTGRQMFLDHIVKNSRHGYYVITPLRLGDEEPPLLVNRGWVQKTGDGPPTLTETAQAGNIVLRGRVSRLPRAAYRMGDAIPAGAEWPRIAVYPTLAEAEAAYGQTLQPFVLLLDPDEPGGFERNWQPAGLGPERHYGYALQWFAMSAVLAILLIWNYSTRRLS